MKLSIIIPVYNEATHLESFLEHLYSIEMPCPTEYVLVDDCSSDGSWEILNAKCQREDTRLHRHKIQSGKGAALHTAIALSTGTAIAVQDADFEYELSDLKTLLAPIMNDEADVVYGSRFKTSHNVHRTYHYLANRFLTLLSNLFSGLYLTDMETCYKVFRSDVLKGLHLESRRFGFEPEVTAKIARLNLRIREYPISYHPRGYLEGKKIRPRDGIAALWFIFKYNLISLKKCINEKLPVKYIPQRRGFLHGTPAPVH